MQNQTKHNKQLVQPLYTFNPRKIQVFCELYLSFRRPLRCPNEDFPANKSCRMLTRAGAGISYVDGLDAVRRWDMVSPNYLSLHAHFSQSRKAN